MRLIAASASLLFLLTGAVVTVTPTAGSALEVNPDKMGFLDGAGGMEESPKDGATTRIVGGDMADKTRYPYYSALFRGRYNDKGRFKCGGSLIREDVVLTAAHCVYGYVSALSFEVAVNFTSHADLRYAYPRNVSQIVMHQKYDPIFLFNDIALLFLDGKVTRVTPIKLNTDAGIPIDDEILKAIGAGATTDFGMTYPTDLWEVNLPKVNNDKCNSAYTPIGFPAGETRILCAGYDKGGKTTCFGDSGGPLFLAGVSPESDLLVGVTSSLYLDDCSARGFPPSFTRVSEYSDWIDSTMSCGGSGSCTSSPTISPTKTPTPTVSPTLPSPQSLPGPSVNITVLLLTDKDPSETSLGYRNLCTNANTTILESNSTALNFTRYNYTSVLRDGEYEFFIADSWGDGISKYGGKGFWSLIAGDATLYQNYMFEGSLDRSGLIIVGLGCKPKNPSRSCRVSREYKFVISPQLLP